MLQTCPKRRKCSDIIEGKRANIAHLAGAPLYPGYAATASGFPLPPPTSFAFQLPSNSENCYPSRQFGRSSGGSARSAFRIQGRTPMNKVDRRSALAIGLAAASACMVKPAASQTTDIVGKDTTPYPGVVMRVYSETPAIIPGFKTVQLRD